MARRRRRRTILTSEWWGREILPGHRARRAARSGGSQSTGFIAGIKALWAIPATRGGRRRTVRRR